MQAEFPTAPRVKVRVAKTAEENAHALVALHVANASRAIDEMGDAELLALLEEPETLAGLSVLERELVVRLGAYVKQ